MELYLMRHGEAQESIVDPARPLTDRGRMTVERVAAVAAGRGARMDRIYHSGILRAQQTAELLAQHAASDVPVEHWAGLEPEAPVSAAAQWLLDRAHDPNPESIAVVSHLPFLERLVEDLLVGANGNRAPTFRPSTLAKLVLDASGHGFRVEWVVNPDRLG